MVNKTEQVPYQCNKTETRMRTDQQTFQVPVQKTTTKMVSVTKKVPRTIYVDVTTQVPKQCTTTVMENRTKMVSIPYSVQVPYTVQVPVTKYRTETKQVPVQRQKTVTDNVTETVFDTQVRTRCEPKVTYVAREIPVYNVVAKPAAPCPPDQPCGGGGAIDAGLQ